MDELIFSTKIKTLFITEYFNNHKNKDAEASLFLGFFKRVNGSIYLKNAAQCVAQLKW